ncbi:MAG: hypothetical protein IPG34_19395 [Rhodocyclaceae bacterium]|nr:hypothetical protein [Rhodocyclaceae bacterium]
MSPSLALPQDCGWNGGFTEMSGWSREEKNIASPRIGPPEDMGKLG